MMWALAAAMLGGSSIVATRDGNVWFTEVVNGRIGRVTPAGVYSDFLVPTRGTRPFGIAAARSEGDGRIWCSVPGVERIGCISDAGTIREYPLPTRSAHPQRMAVASDSSVWFVEFGIREIGRLTP